MFGFAIALGFMGLAVFAIASLHQSFAGIGGVVRTLQAGLANADLVKTYSIRSEDLVTARSLPSRRSVATGRAARRPVAGMPAATPGSDRRRIAA